MNNPSASGMNPVAMRAPLPHPAAAAGPTSNSVDMIEVVDLDSPAAAAAAATLGEDDVIAVSASAVPSSSWPPPVSGGATTGGGMQLSGANDLSESVVSLQEVGLDYPVFLMPLLFPVLYQRSFPGIDYGVLLLLDFATYSDAIAVKHPHGSRPVVLEILLAGDR